MAYILNKLIEVTPVKGGIDVTCQADTGHICKEYIRLRVKQVHFTAIPSGEVVGKEDDPVLDILACVNCMHKFQVEVHQALLALQ